MKAVSFQLNLWLLLILITAKVQAQSGFSVLHAFNGTNGADPNGGLTLSGGFLYGTTIGGGIYFETNYSGNAVFRTGTVFMINTNGTGFTVLRSFSGRRFNAAYTVYTNIDGAGPNGSLGISGGMAYGTASAGGTNGNGTVFAVGTNGAGFTVLKTFGVLTQNTITGAWTNSDGAMPYSGLVVAGNTLFGTTYTGGNYGYGTVFKINTDGSGYSILHHFANLDGQNPQANLILSGGTLYGTTTAAGSAPGGVVFKIGTNGIGFTVVLTGVSSSSGLALSGNTLYGTTTSTIFSITTNGSGYTVIKSLTGVGGFNQVYLSGNILFGTTTLGGSSGYGAMYQINTDGTGYNVLRSFSTTTHSTNSDGAYPSGALAMLGRTVYGVTSSGSVSNGNVFSFVLPTATVSLSPLAQTYYGGPVNVQAVTSPQGLPVVVSYNGSSTRPTNAGNYTVIGTINDLNYPGGSTNTLVVNKTSATLTLNGLFQLYDGTAKMATASSVPNGLALNVSYNNEPNAPTNVGNYTVKATVTDLNYQGGTTNTLIIGVPPQTLSLTTTNNMEAGFYMVGTPNYPYILQSATYLTPPINWLPVITNIADENGNWTVMMSNIQSAAAGFYRVMAQ